MKRIYGEKVRDIRITRGMSINDLVIKMRDGGGFVARYLGEAVDILEEMVRDERCVKFLSFPAAPVATGLRGVLRDLVQKRLVDVIITSSGTLDHDLARSFAEYYLGDFRLDDVMLKKRGLHRLGNLLIPKDAYGPLLEEKIQPLLEQIYAEGVRELSSYQLTSRLGRYIDNELSILYSAYKNNIPVIVPGVTDGAVGSQIWLFTQRHRDFRLNPLLDEELLSDIIFRADKAGAIMIGGGITKHHTLWWNQFRDGLDYAVFITTAVEYDGSLSGALIKEAVSWGKVKTRAKQVTIHGDATAILPFIVAALMERVSL